MKSLLVCALVPIFIIAVGVANLNFNESDVSEFGSDNPTLKITTEKKVRPNFNEASFSKGFVEIIHTDSNGNILNHIKQHNLIVTHGENCVAKMMFGLSGGDETGSTVCVGELNNGFNYIGLGEGTTSPTDGDIDLENPADETGLSTPLQGSLTFTNSTNGSFFSVDISATFTNTGASENISEIALLNDTSVSTRGMFARNTFTPITVNTSDDITVIWTQQYGKGTLP